MNKLVYGNCAETKKEQTLYMLAFLGIFEIGGHYIYCMVEA